MNTNLISKAGALRLRRRKRSFRRAGVDWNMNYHPSWYPYDGEWRKDENGKRYYYYYTLNDFYPTMW